MSELKVTKLSDIKPEPIKRYSLYYIELDDMYGKSDLPVHNTGVPLGKISLWSGESGVGKSRLCIDVAKNFCKTYSNGRVLYIQTESTLSDFASWAKDTAQYDRIFCSSEDNIDNIVDLIYKVKPHLIFVDSVNELEGFENGTKQESKRLIKGEDNKPGLKQAVSDTNSHMILLAQLNQDGKTIKGGTSLPHLVDVHVNLVKTNYPGEFICKIGIKNRYGSKEKQATFLHRDYGVDPTFGIDLHKYRPLSSLGNNQSKERVVEPKVQKRIVKPQERRVEAMTRSGSCRVNDNGFADINDPEFQEHLTNYRNSSKGQKFLNRKRSSLWSRLNTAAGRIIGKE